MIKSFTLAQVALKSYAVAFILLLLMPPPLIVPFTVFNVAVSTIIIGVVSLLCEQLNKGENN